MSAQPRVHRLVTRRWAPLLVAGLCALAPGQRAHAQFPRGGPPPGPPPPAREAQPIDITGYWVSIVNEDWRWRMVTPPKGDTTSLTMLSRAGRAATEAWDPAEDGSCKAYGAAGIMRMPTRLKIDWESENVLRVQTDAGRQTRRFEFAGADAAREPSLQGDSAAQWQFPSRPPGFPGLGAAARTPGGSLQVTTTNLLPGWLRRNGVPYSEQTVLTEYFDTFEAPNGDVWLVVTSVVEDPVYLTGRFVTSSHFRREPDGSSWHPTSCKAG